MPYYNNFSKRDLIKSFIARKKKIILFLKSSFLFTIIFSTFLYILMRLFFIGFEFETSESIELYIKTLFVTWSYILIWRIICYGIIRLEGNMSKTRS
ncbi:MAG: hypothetical protein WBP16_03310 [Ferruginibacter sp.]